MSGPPFALPDLVAASIPGTLEIGVLRSIKKVVKNCGSRWIERRGTAHKVAFVVPI